LLALAIPDAKVGAAINFTAFVFWFLTAIRRIVEVGRKPLDS
jgi:hypothetical protein